MSRSKVRQEEAIKSLLKALREEEEELADLRDKIDEKLSLLESKRLTLTRTFD